MHVFELLLKNNNFDLSLKVTKLGHVLK